MSTPKTRLDAYEAVREDGEDVTLRRAVAERIAEQGPLTTHEIASGFDDHGKNAIRPRVSELLRMDCLERDGRRKNPSGHDAYIHHLTPLGERYVDGDEVPDPGPTLSDYQRRVVEMTRGFLNGDVDRQYLRMAVENHDDLKRKMDPEWDPDNTGDDE